MQVTLMHNPKAGGGKHGQKQLIAALKEVGHQALYQSTKKKNFGKALREPTDLVLIAGGDGTVTKIARCLIDTGTPISVLPLGTANNLARSLGFSRPIAEIICGLAKGENRLFDVAVARGPWGKRYVFEGAGAGLLADYVYCADRKKERRSKTRISKERELARHVARLRRLLDCYRPQDWDIEIDGQDVSGRYILWEAMNVRSVGPALYLAPSAKTKDGELNFVAAREQDLNVLSKHLDASAAGKITTFPLPMRTFRELNVQAKNTRVHLDDKVWPKHGKKKKIKIKISVQPSALVVRQPPPPTN